MSRILDVVAPRRLGSGFRWLLASYWLTNLGDGFTIAAGPLLVASQTRSPALVAAAAFLQRLPWLLFGLYAVVALLYAGLPAGATAEGAVKYPGKATVTFSDAISAVRRQLWLEGVFESQGQAEAFRNLPRPLQAVLLAALAPAA